MDEKTCIVIVVILGALLLAVLIIRFSLWLQWFRREMRYLNKEIQRTEGEEKEEWLKRKRKLIRTIVPFLR